MGFTSRAWPFWVQQKTWVFEKVLPTSRAWPSNFVSPKLCGWWNFCLVVLFPVTIYDRALFLVLLFFFFNPFFSLEFCLLHARIRNLLRAWGRVFCRLFLFTVVVPSFQDFCFSSLIQFGSFKLLPLSFKSSETTTLCLGSALWCSELANVFKEKARWMWDSL